jgi:hypothetical protein
MKKRLLKFVLPISLGLMLSMLTFLGLISITFVSCYDHECPNGSLLGSDGICYSCIANGIANAHATYSYEGVGCSDGIKGVYCCPGVGNVKK